MIGKITEILTMPQTVDAMFVVGIIITFLFFVAFIFKESSSDERESAHILKASRISYLVGVGVLTLALIVQTLMHSIDVWIIYAVVAMILSKLISRIYSHYRM